MTRGKLHLIESHAGWATMQQSCEFNGDMCPGGHYEVAVEALKKVEQPVDFYKAVLAFDISEEFNYQNDKDGYFEFYRTPLFHIERPENTPIIKGKAPYVSFDDDGIMIIDFSKDYFEYWFSDYIFFKITGDKPVKFRIADKKETIQVEPGEVVTFNYGNDPKKY